MLVIYIYIHNPTPQGSLESHSADQVEMFVLGKLNAPYIALRTTLVIVAELKGHLQVQHQISFLDSISRYDISRNRLPGKSLKT